MIVCFDAMMLVLLFDAEAKAPLDKATGKPVTDCKDRLSFLVDTLSRRRGSRIIVPAPALAEFLVRCTPETTPDYINLLQRIRSLRIAPFAEKAAIEFADLQRASIPVPGRRIKASDTETRAKAKFDQQIVAIARAEGASTIYSDDGGLAKYAARVGIETIGVAALPMSPDSAQGNLPLVPPEAVSTTEPKDDR